MPLTLIVAFGPSERGGGQSAAATSSAICAVFSAAPLRRLSPQTNRSSARGIVERPAHPPYPRRVGAHDVRRGRELAALRVIGEHDAGGLAQHPLRRRAGSTSRPKTACTATECVVTTGTRTQVADTRRSGSPRIFRDSLRIFSSSEDHPSSLTDPAQGTTFSASGAGNGPGHRRRRGRHPARCPSERLPPTRSSCAYSVSMPACPAPDAAW